MLVELGKLTAVAYRDRTSGRRRVLRWGLRKAPSLAYDERGKLHVAYARKFVRDATPEEVREYARTHWGEKGDGQLSDVRVAGPPLRELGRGISVTYTTAKGRAELVDWEHDWGEGGRGRCVVPKILVHVCQNDRCSSAGTILLAGGTYRVTSRGIVG